MHDGAGDNDANAIVTCRANYGSIDNTNHIQEAPDDAEAVRVQVTTSYARSENVSAS